MKDNSLAARVVFFLLGLFLMAIGVALSCKADLGTMPIASVPWVISMFTGWSIGELTIAMNLIFIAVQPVLLRNFYWREIIGQFFTLIVFGSSIDFAMYLLGWVAPANLGMKWFDCLLSSAVLALGLFFCVRAKVFLAAGDGLVLAITFVTKAKLGFIKNCFDITLVIVALAITFTEFGEMRGVGAGTIAAAILVGRFVQLYMNRLHIFDRFLAKEE